MTRAVGIVRVSKQGEREDEAFHSPETQTAAIATHFGAMGWDVDILPFEINVSGAAALIDRPSLSKAVASVAAGTADAIVALDASRLWRDNEVRMQVLRAIGDEGEVWTVKDGRISNESARSRFMGTVTTGADQMQREETAEKVAAAVTRAIGQGLPPFRLPPGLKRVGNHVEIDEQPAQVVRQAVEMRANGATIAQVRQHLRDNGIERSYASVNSLMQSPILVGDIVYGDQRGRVPPIVNRDLWERARRYRSPRGRRAKSERLLARLGIVVCGSCGSRMTVGTSRNGAYPQYKCSAQNGCTGRATISAPLVEEVVEDHVREAVRGTVGFRSPWDNTRAARQRLWKAQGDLDAALSAFKGLETEPAAIERLGVFRAERDAAQEALAEMGEMGDDELVLLSHQWDDLSFEDKRRAIRAVVRRAVIQRGGRGRERIALEPWPFFEAPPMPRDLS